MKFSLISIEPYTPEGFLFINKIDLSLLRRKPFILYANDLNYFLTVNSSSLDSLTGIIISITDEPGSFVRLADMLWHVTLHRSLEGSIHAIADGYAAALSEVVGKTDEKNRMQNQYNKLVDEYTRNYGGNAFIEKLLHDTFLKNSQWLVKSLTTFVGFAVNVLEPLDQAEYPQEVVNYLSSGLFNYTRTSMYMFNVSANQWALIAGGPDQSEQIPHPPGLKEYAILLEKGFMFSFFRVLEENYVILIASDDESRVMSDYERSFITTFTMLIASYYKMKKLSHEVEERIVEVNTLKTARDLISGLRNGTISLQEVILEMRDNLSLEGVALALPDAKTGKMEIAMAQGSDITDWDDFPIKVITNVEKQYEGWEISFLFDRYAYYHGAIAYKLMWGNPTLFSIQKRVLHFFVPQVIDFLTEQKLHSEVITDSQTNLYNRRYFIKILNDRINRAKSDPAYNLSVAMIDIDHFKEVNDTYGHLIGDMVIKKIAAHFIDGVRGDDLVGRFGGDEFIVILNADLRGSLIVINKIRERIAEDRMIDGFPDASVTISSGVAAFGEGVLNQDMLIEHADHNLYSAKAGGRNTVVPVWR